MSCTDIRQTTIDAGLGDIHAGSYCPENEFRLLHCPQGYYCNSTDMSTKSLCPAGMFCPLKVRQIRRAFYYSQIFLPIIDTKR